MSVLHNNSNKQHNRIQGEGTMLPLIVSGVFLVGLMVGKKLHKPSEPWNSREEEQYFYTDQKHWVQERWILYGHVQR
jgi:hypothetical protein